ncbi:MAG: hypothetical protein L3J83_06705 [Proteobacteria bacterium]|nr:hypothetical protein [Pseudomonadota bacterium]
MNIAQKNIDERFYAIYRKHVKRYSHTDTNQMCCMWSISNPPDQIFETAQIYDIENEFDLELTEDDAMELYDMDCSVAIAFIQRKLEENNR